MSSFREWKWEVKLVLAGIYFTFLQKTYRTGGLSFQIPLALTDLKFRGRFPLDVYEQEERRHLKAHLPPNSTVLELGACLGVVSCLSNKLLADPSKHVVVEANPQLIGWIEKNKAENGCGFHIEHCMVSKEKECTFYLHDLIVGGSAVRATPKAVQVPGRSIADLEAKYSLRFDTLLIDIEGGEFFFLPENKEALSRFTTIMMEVHPFSGILTSEQAKQCEVWMEEMGFSLMLRDGHFQIWKRGA